MTSNFMYKMSSNTTGLTQWSIEMTNVADQSFANGPATVNY